MASTDRPTPRGDGDVFGNLPNTRPQRRSAKRDRPAGAPQARAAAHAAKAPTARASAKAGRGAAASKASARAASEAGRKAPRRTRRAPAAPQVPAAGYATPRDDDGPPRGADLVTTALQAVGELALIGVTAGLHALRTALRRLPRP